MNYMLRLPLALWCGLLLAMFLLVAAQQTQASDTLSTTTINADTASISEAALESSQSAPSSEPVALDEILNKCAACHGAQGNSAVGTYPKLAGQHVNYLLKQLEDIQSGARPVPLMAGQLDGLSAQQLTQLAAYYSAQEMSLNAVADEDLELGEKIYRLGNIEKGLPACSGCHSPRGDGNAPAAFPKLGGQHAAYIVASLKAYRAGAEYPQEGRSNDPMQGVMRGVAIRMTDKEIEAVANFISGLH